MLQNVNVPGRVLPRAANLLRAAALLAPSALAAAGLASWVHLRAPWPALLALGAALAGYVLAPPLLLHLLGARAVDPSGAPHLLAMIRELAARCAMPVPRVCVLDSHSPNAWAVGHAGGAHSLMLTSGILRLLDEAELRAVLAHEFSHMERWDPLPSTLAAAFGGLLSALAHAGAPGPSDRMADEAPAPAPLWLLLAPLSAGMARLARARWQDIVADRAGAELCGDPAALVRALHLLHADERRVLALAVRHPATASMMVCDPLPQRGGLRRMFRAHPPLEQRLRALGEQPVVAAQASGAAIEGAFEGGVDQQAGQAVQQGADEGCAEAANLESRAQR